MFYMHAECHTRGTALGLNFCSYNVIVSFYTLICVPFAVMSTTKATLGTYECSTQMLQTGSSTGLVFSGCVLCAGSDIPGFCPE